MIKEVLFIIIGILIASLYVLNFLPMETIIIIDNESFREDGNLKGFSSGAFYCVKTDNEFNYNIADVEDHEICHNLVKNDPKHFCN